jgi:hypothetical protein
MDSSTLELDFFGRMPVAVTRLVAQFIFENVSKKQQRAVRGLSISVVETAKVIIVITANESC